ncbi:hypothetical protein [Paenibacillus sp. FJAT-27812]|uniref:hypothetical protein n=1 Tax=Paenibacillus sp. FJAT-27812 TaxID=1684143 RepID=UPI0012FB02A7|nr:hypothetical protein [Paenibacillus sp. FJAT-27812]
MKSLWSKVAAKQLPLLRPNLDQSSLRRLESSQPLCFIGILQLSPERQDVFCLMGQSAEQSIDSVKSFCKACKQMEKMGHAEKG